jgi:thymidylate kinase
MEDAELIENARRVHQDITGKQVERPLFVEFSGSPKSGKSTCIEIVGHFLRRIGFRVLAPTEGASKRTPYYLKNDLTAFNTWSACYALNHVLEGLYHSDRYHVAILDRGLFDALVWFELLKTQGSIAQDDRDRVQNFLLMDKWRSVIDGVFLFKADPETSMEREQRDKLIDEPGTAMNPEFLQGLNDAYEQVKRLHAGKFPNFEVIDTGKAQGTTPRSTASQVVNVVLDLLRQRIL